MDYSLALPVGRSLRLLFGGAFLVVLWLGNPAITEHYFGVLGYLGLIISTYIVMTIIIGQRVIVRVNPWLGALIMDSPVALTFIPAIPSQLQLAILLFPSLSLICAALCAFGGCEVLAIPNMLLRKRYNVACMIFSPIDWIEQRITKTNRN